MMKLPLHRLDATTIRMIARDMEAQARALHMAADEAERAAVRAAARARGLRAFQEARRAASGASRVSALGALLATACSASAAARSGIPLRTVQRVRSELMEGAAMPAPVDQRPRRQSTKASTAAPAASHGQ